MKYIPMFIVHSFYWNVYSGLFDWNIISRLLNSWLFQYGSFLYCSQQSYVSLSLLEAISLRLLFAIAFAIDGRAITVGEKKPWITVQKIKQSSWERKLLLLQSWTSNNYMGSNREKSTILEKFRKFQSNKLLL